MNDREEQQREDGADELLDQGMAKAFGDHHDTGDARMGSILRRLQDRTKSLLTGVHLVEEDAARTPMVQISPEAKALRDPTGRYQMVGEIGRGGVGIVFKGRDQDLGRDVAMKVLKDDYAAHPEVLARFVEEAQIGGQLQHPGIVPVYELGLQAGERPYFAMKLVKGETLAAQLARRVTPKEDRRRLLGVFEQICQTMGYAHSRRVVHRDLKPANVMIGAFGEVQVVDWGFAKVLPKGGVADERSAKRTHAESVASVIETVRSKEGSGSQSVAGSMLGTPAYMPPEQALGDIDSLDERSDVFGLGAILCEILTGAPPYVDSDEDGEVVRQAAKAELGPALKRLDESGADAALLELCKACLAPAAKARPRSGAAVAERISAYLTSVEERAQQAELRATQARWRQRMTMFAAAAGAVFLIAGGLVWMWAEEQERGRLDLLVNAVAEAETEANAAYAKAVANGLDENNWDAALVAARNYADKAAGDGVPKDRLADATAQLTTVRERATAAAKERDRLARDAAMLASLDALLIPPDHQDKDTQPIDLVQAEDLGYLAAFDAYLGSEPFATAPFASVVEAMQRGDIVLRLATTLDYWAILRDELTDADIQVDERLTRRIRRLAATLDADHRQRNDLRDLLDDSEPDAARLRDLANTVDLRELTADGCRILVRALWRVEEKEAAYDVIHRGQELHPSDFQIFSQGAWFLGNATAELAQRNLAALRVARALRPGSSEIRHRQAIALAKLERIDEAMAIFRELAKNQPLKRAHWLGHIAMLLHRQHKWQEAAATSEQAYKLYPDDQLIRANYALELTRTKRFAEALPIAERNVEQSPEDAHLRNTLGVALLWTGQIEEAKTQLERAIELDPESSYAITNLGKLALQENRRDDAKLLFERANAIDGDNYDALFQLGKLAMESKQFEQAREWFARANATRPNDVSTLGNLAAAYSGLKQFDLALEAIEKAHARDKDNPFVLYNLGVIHHKRGEIAPAMAALERAIEVDPSFAPPWDELVGVLRQQQRFSEALELATEGVKRHPDHAILASRAVELQMVYGDLDLALQLAQDAVARHPKVALLFSKLANCLENKGRMPEAEAALRECLRLDPGTAEAHFNLARLQVMNSKHEDAIASFELAAKHFGKHPHPAMQRWAAAAQQSADQWRQKLAAYRQIVAGERLARDPREWEQAVHYAVKNETPAPELLRLLEISIAQHPELTTRQARAPMFRAAGKVADWLVEQPADKQRDARRVVRESLALAVRTISEAKANDPESKIARRGARNLKGALGDDSYAAFRDDAIDALPEAERDAWRTLWQKMRALTEDQ